MPSALKEPQPYMECLLGHPLWHFKCGGNVVESACWWWASKDSSWLTPEWEMAIFSMPVPIPWFNFACSLSLVNSCTCLTYCKPAKEKTFNLSLKSQPVCQENLEFLCSASWAFQTPMRSFACVAQRSQGLVSYAETVRLGRRSWGIMLRCNFFTSSCSLQKTYSYICS